MQRDRRHYENGGVPRMESAESFNTQRQEVCDDCKSEGDDGDHDRVRLYADCVSGREADRHGYRERQTEGDRDTKETQRARII